MKNGLAIPKRRSPTRERTLEREFPGELENSRIKRRVDLAEIGVVDVKRVRHREVGVVENVECFKTQFDAEAFLESNAFDKRRINVPVTWTINRSQTQRAKVSCGRVSKVGRAGATICSDQSRVNEQRKSRFWIMVQANMRLELRKR